MAIDERETGLAVAEEDGGDPEERDDEMEIRDLEAEVSEMADMLQKSRKSLPGRLADALSKQLSAQRPHVAVDETSGFQDCISQNDTDELESGASIPDLDPEMHQKFQILRTKIRSNMEAMPEVLKRIKGCIERVNRLDQSNDPINPVFKKKRKHSQLCL